MPIFHEPFDRPPRRSLPQPRHVSHTAHRRAGTTTYGLDSCPGDTAYLIDPQNSSRTPISNPQEPASHIHDRMDLIERIKRVKSPLWHQRHNNGSQSFDPHSASQDRPMSPLLPSAQLQPSRTSTPDPLREHASAGLGIERPRSALHSGDFRQKRADGQVGNQSSSDILATSPVVPWNRSFPSAALPTRCNEANRPFSDALTYQPPPTPRTRATSQSSFNSFAFMPPTSPLVQESNNADLDSSSRPGSRRASRSPDRSYRRHTFSPDSFANYQSGLMARSATGTPAARHLRHGGPIPCQAHQPRRSMNLSNQFQPHSNPQTPFLGSRRPSISSEASPLHHAPMVGSYEESILRGRMSTTPSRPLDFVAKIGVLGRGQCKSSLKCPPHVTVPFPAVFYSYNTGNGRISDNEPSPYVGLIDLENSLPAPEENQEAGRRKRRHAIPVENNSDLDFPINVDETNNQSTKDDMRRREKKKRRSASPKAPPGGCYRIPPQGQLQIVLKNPNNTAVKLFLVPYDLSDMEPGQKTFVRQRSYSAGPIIDMPLSSRKNLGTDRPEAAISHSDDPKDRPILRYLIHLHMCCPSKGRYYLYKSIRVVFANRVPDGKEKLRNEIQQPEPRYSTYKPARDATTPQAATSAGAQLAAEKAYRRRTTAWPLSRSQQMYDQMDGIRQHQPLPPPAVQFTGGPLSTSASASTDYSSPTPLLQPIPFSLTRLAAIESRPVSREQMDVDSRTSFRVSITSPKPGEPSSIGEQEGSFEKLSRGDVGYGGNAFSPIASPVSSPTAGLLTQRLRGLEVHPDDHQNPFA